MAYAAVTSLMETLSLHFLQSQPPFPLEHLAAQIRDDANRNLGLLQQILEDMATKDVKVELDEAASSKGIPRLHGIFNNRAVKQSDYPKKKKKKKLIKSEKQQQQLLLAECSSSQNERITNWLREVGEVKQKIVSLHQNLGLLQQSLEESEIAYDDAEMKDLVAQMRDTSFKAEERIEMELSAIYLAKESLLHVTPCLLRLHQIFNEAEKQTDYKIRDYNENLGLLQQIVEEKIREMELDEEASASKSFLPRLYGNIQQLARLREVGEVKQKMLSLHKNLGLLQKDILQKSEISNDDAGAMKDLKAEMRDVWFKAEERIEIELTTFYIPKKSIDQDQLADSLCKHLKEQRYLIVMDDNHDIWSTTAWDSVQRCFPDDNNGNLL